MTKLIIKLQQLMDSTQHLSFLAPLMIRLYLFPVFWIAGTNKLQAFDSTAMWFGNPDWGLGLPFPYLMAGLAVAAEVIGSIFILMGFATRWATIPLMVTMIVAAVSVHLENGWQAVHDLMSPWANENAAGASERLERANAILQEHGNYEWLTEHGSFIISNNGIEWAATYFITQIQL